VDGASFSSFGLLYVYVERPCVLSSVDWKLSDKPNVVLASRALMSAHAAQ
jgi:hypothetical protein